MSIPKSRPVSISATLFEQTQSLARRLDISQDRLVEIAVEQFLETRQPQPGANEDPRLPQPDAAAETQSESSIEIHQGGVYWVQLETGDDAQPGIPHPHVVLQDDLFNQSRIQSVVVCGLTSNIRRANAPGNILLEAGEAHLPRQSVIEVSKVSAVARAQIGDYIGSLSQQRIEQIFAGMRFLQRSFMPRRGGP